MDSKIILRVILVVSTLGVLFSGYLSYLEIFVPLGCGMSPISCGEVKVVIGDFPACFYGLLMFTLITILSVVGLFYKKEN